VKNVIAKPIELIKIVRVAKYCMVTERERKSEENHENKTWN